MTFSLLPKRIPPTPKRLLSSTTSKQTIHTRPAINPETTTVNPSRIHHARTSSSSSSTISTTTTIFTHTFQPPPSLSKQHRNLAIQTEFARKANIQIPPLSHSIPDLTQSTAYEIAAYATHLRQTTDNEHPIGRKLGFTNKSLWKRYNVDESNWGYIYDTSVHYDIKYGTTVDLSDVNQLEPKIEPEIIFGLKSTPRVGMNEMEILECVDWIAHGFEIVQSVFPRWEFTAVDTTAVSALHGRLLVGPKMYLNLHHNDHNNHNNDSVDASTTTEDNGNPSLTRLHQQLQTFTLTLSRNNTEIDRGSGNNILDGGGPVSALSHLIRVLSDQMVHPLLAAGEVVSTGTLTGAFDVRDGDVWRSELQGLDGIGGLEVRFVV